MNAALQGQLLPGQQLERQPCIPTQTTNHTVGDETATVTVTIALTCSAIAYNSQELTTQAEQLLNSQASESLGTGYTRYGDVKVSVTKAITTAKKTVVLTFTALSTWIYQINENALKALLSGKTRIQALQLLTHIQGIKRVNISGIGNTDLIPTDPGHVKFLLIYAAF
jgi:hypothetical protein